MEADIVVFFMGCKYRSNCCSYFRGVVDRPYPDGRGDANADGYILGSDVTYLVNYFSGSGPPPPPSGVVNRRINNVD